MAGLRIGRRGLAAALALLIASPAWAAPRLLESRPATDAQLPAPANLFELRFDEPVNHYQSRLEILRDGQVLETLTPRLETEPRILAAQARPLAPGAYQLRWLVRSAFDGSVSEGTISFTVR